MTVRHGTANIATPHVRTPSPAPSGHLGLRRIVFRWRQLLGLLSKVLPTLWWMVAWLHKHKCQHQAMALPTLCSVWPVAAPNQSSTPTSQDCAYTKCKPGPISCRATGAQFAGAATAPTKATFGFARKAAGSGSGSGNNSCNKHSSPEGTCPAKWWRPRHTRQQSPRPKVPKTQRAAKPTPNSEVQSDQRQEAKGQVTCALWGWPPCAVVATLPTYSTSEHVWGPAVRQFATGGSEPASMGGSARGQTRHPGACWGSWHIRTCEPWGDSFWARPFCIHWWVYPSSHECGQFHART